MMNTFSSIRAIYADLALGRMAANKCPVDRVSTSVSMFNT